MLCMGCNIAGAPVMYRGGAADRADVVDRAEVANRADVGSGHGPGSY
jgi:hypothetical protein